jgi:leucokinin receptor
LQVSDGPGGVKPFCQAFFPSLGAVDWGKVYRLYLATIQYFLPMTVLTYAYCRIIHKIWLTKAPGSAVDSRDQIRNRNKRKV